MKGEVRPLTVRTRQRAVRSKIKRIDYLTIAQRSNLMRKIKSKDTGPELALAAALKKARRRFELHCDDLPGKPDIVYRRKRLAVFIDGEFWHGGQWRKRGLTSLGQQFKGQNKSNTWTAKIEANASRDLNRTSELLAAGWTVIRLWAEDIQKDVTRCAKLVLDALQNTAPTSPASYIPSRNVAEFFAGIGLAHMGLCNAGWTVRFANDYSPDKLAFYKANFDIDSIKLDERDIHDVQKTNVPTVALATACFPCTDLSMAGAQRGLEPGTESSAYLKFTTLLKEMKDQRPPFVLLENVVGMIHSRDGKDFKICLQQLAKAGYTLDSFVLDAKWFVPHSRPRLFVIAVRNDLNVEQHITAERVKEAATLRPIRLTEFISANSDLPWSLRTLPSPRRRRRTLKAILQKLPDDDYRWWTRARATRLYRQMSSQHRKSVRSFMKKKRPTYSTVFRRMRDGKSMAELRTDGLAGCLRTPKGGSASQILLRASNGKYDARLLTPRECARLMGADTIRIPKESSMNAALFAFGDGVCVPVIRWIAKYYLNPLATELIHGCVLKSPQFAELAEGSHRRNSDSGSSAAKLGASIPKTS